MRICEGEQYEWFYKEKVILGVEDMWFGAVARNLTGGINLLLH